MKRTTRFLSMLLVVVMLIGMLPISTLAEETGTEPQQVQETTQVDSTEPEATDTQTPTEEATEPSAEVTEPASEETEPENTEPEASEPEATEPAQDEPVAGEEPGAGDEILPGETEPETTEPGQTEDPNEGIDLASAEDDGIIYILAGSDFQPTDGKPDTGVTLLNAILDKIPASYAFDGFLFAGDYNYNSDESGCIAGRNAVDSTVTGKYPTITHEVYVQGNHDLDNMTGLSASGNNDPTSGEYGVFVINEKDYMWYNNDATTIESTASNLSAYLTAKADAGYTKPIFVVSHLPLHYSLRTQTSGNGDGKYAKYIFDVLQTAGERGLNVIFLYGHNHSHGWDDPYGGAAVYLQPGNNINIAKVGSTTEYTAEALKFTYMNAGFVSYYKNVNNGACTDLTMTVFIIKDGQVEVERYSAAGQVSLKAAGVLNTAHSDNNSSTCCGLNGTETYAADTSTVWEDVIPLRVVEENKTVTDDTTNITITAPGVTDVTVEAVEDEQVDTTQFAAYASWDITLEGYTQGDEATVSISAPDGFDPERKVTVWDGAAGTGTSLGEFEIVEGKITFTTTHFSEYAVTQALEGAAPQADDDVQTMYKDEATGVSVSAYGLTGLSVRLVPYEMPTGYTAMAVYEIKPEGATIDETHPATVSITLPENFDPKKVVTVWHGTIGGDDFRTLEGRVEDEKNSYVVFQVKNFTDAFFVLSQGGADTSDAFEPMQMTEKYFQKVNLTQLSDLENGEYLLVYDNNVFFNTSGTNLSSTTATSDGDNRLAYYNNAENHLWTVEVQDDGTVSLQSSSGGYLYILRRNNVSINRTQPQYLKTTVYNGGLRFGQTVGNTTYYIRYNAGSLTTTTTQNNATAFSLYRLVETNNDFQKVEPLPMYADYDYAKLEADEGGQYIYRKGIYLDLIEAEIKYYTRVTLATDETGTGAMVINDYQVDASGVDPQEPGEYPVTISYNGQKLGQVTVTIQERTITGITVVPQNGTLERGSNVTSSVIVVSYDDETFHEIPLRLSFITDPSGKLDANQPGTYTGLTVTYQGHTVTGYQLEVVNREGVDNPVYPEPGSVKVNKTATGLDFQNTGLARVNLSTSGLPSTKGVDVVIVLDTSSSMRDNSVPSGRSRFEVMIDTLRQMLTTFNTPNPTTGKVSDIDVAIIDFNGYANTIDGASLTGTYRTNADASSIYTGVHAGEEIADLVDKGYNYIYEGAFEKSINLTSERIETILSPIEVHGGTNYDAALSNAYNVLKYKKAHNTEEREQFVIFLSDGAPFRYNGFNQGDTHSQYPIWDQWLSGDWASSDAIPASYSGDQFYHFYNGNGSTHPHRAAEAIKGTPGVSYDVVNPTKPDSNYIDQYEGLGATIYAIGFGLENDGTPPNAVMKDTMMELIETISSGTGFAYPDVQTEAELSEAFNQIANAISFAAQNATFEDKMGEYFELQMNPNVQVSGGQTKTEDTSITIKTSPIYTKDQVGTEVNGHQVTAEDVGKTYGTGVTVETVRFEVVSGKIGAYSSAIDNGATNIINDKGVICAANFWYNTNQTPVSITLSSGAAYTLDAEAFRWNIGTINEAQYELSYVVKLSNSMGEPGVPAGSYATNEYARLTYMNWLGNTVTQSVVSPEMAWEAAQLSYGFYLVDSEGRPLMANGEVAENFGLAQKLTNPIFYQMVNLNTGAEVISINVNTDDVLKLGYQLYDSGAGYQVQINSGDGLGSWKFTYKKGDSNSTYVTNYAGLNDFTNQDVDGVQGYSYTNTVVWFAVEWTVGALDDTVVIDYGLPVDISVMSNDIFGTSGKLAGVGMATIKPTDKGTEMVAGFAAENVLSYGKAAINANTNKVRYTPTTMSMNGKEEFYYAVNYQPGAGADGAGYYYGKVTVIPATSIYFEDSFVTFTDLNYDGSVADRGSVWTQVGKTVDAVQSEDRPGQYSLPEVDANNIYGYDNAYANMTTYSLGSAMMAHVVEKTLSAKAEFTFTGTGFDIVSMTSNMTGNIILRVQGTNYSKFFSVDTYYGYATEEHLMLNTYDAETETWSKADQGPAGTDAVEDTKPTNPEDGATYYTIETVWVVKQDAKNSLYQIPVMKVANLAYGTYTVTLSATYNDAFNHGQDGQDKNATNNSYDIYLDAIRIYDPANNGANDPDIKDAYVVDKEGWPEYHELRDQILDAEDFTAGNATDGVVYIDGKSQDVSIEDYRAYGPNNEVYLQRDQAIAFNLGLTEAQLNNIADVQIAVKSADGSPVVINAWNVKDGGEPFNNGSKEITTSTDLYYSILRQTPANTVTVIRNTGTGIMSITNIKITYKTSPEVPMMASFSITPEEAGWVLMSLSMDYDEPETPEVTEPEVTEPEVTEPEVTEPEVTEPEVTEPEVTEPEVTEPEVTEPEVTEPEVTEPEVTEPEVTEPEVTEPEGTEPEVTEPEVTEPEVTEPEVTEPEVTEPEVTEPEVTEPEVTEPEVTEPEVTEPEVTEPEVTEPEVTEPETTEPEDDKPNKVDKPNRPVINLDSIINSVKINNIYQTIKNSVSRAIKNLIAKWF